MPRASFLIPDHSHGPLRGDVYLPEDSHGAPVVIGCHGFKGFKNWGFWPEIGRRLSKAGLALVTFNFSGSGIGEDLETFSELDRFATNTISKELEDLGRIVEAVSSREVSLAGADPRRLGVLGHSRGGGVALLRVRRDPRVRSVVTWAAVSNFHRYDETQIQTWRKDGFLPILNARTQQVLELKTDLLDDLEAHGETYSPLDAARGIEIPALFLHGTRDETVAPEEANHLARAITPGMGRVSFIQGGTHTFGATHPFTGTTPELEAALRKTLEWFQETLA